MIDKNSVIRKSLQSDSYYKRHRQKARKDVRGPSTEISQGGSVREARQRKGLPPFQNIPLGFMNSLTPKGRARFQEDLTSGNYPAKHRSNKHRKRTSSKHSRHNEAADFLNDSKENFTDKLKKRINLSQE
jgi:hypothetical protein